MSNGTRKENADRVISRRKRALKSLPSDIITRWTAILRADDGPISVISLLDRTFYPPDIFFGGDIRAFVNCFATLKIFFNLACHIFASTIQLAYIFNLVIIVFNVFGIILIDLL